LSRYDKVDPYDGLFRAPLAADFGYTGGVPNNSHADLSKLFAVGLNTSGRIGKFAAGGAFPRFAGVMILTAPRSATSMVDIMTDGEIVDLVDAEIKGADTLAAGTALYADTATADGLLTTTATAMRYVGFTVELSRLIVRCQFSGTGA
jgi:hypothetical protein